MTDIFDIEQKYKNMDYTHDDFEEEEYLHIKDTADGLIVYCKSYTFSELYLEFTEALILPENSNKIKKLFLHSTDSGCNGTNSWYLEYLTEGFYPLLEVFEVQRNKPTQHNSNIIEGNNIYQESGVIADFCKKMPKLKSLTIPSAPEKNFFEFQNEIEEIYMDTGYAHNDFLTNLANSKNLKNLRTLEFGEIDPGFGISDKDRIQLKDLEYFLKSDMAKQINMLILKDLLIPQKNILNIIEKIKGFNLNLQMINTAYTYQYINNK